MINSIDTDNTFNKNPTPFSIKTINKLKTEWYFLNLIKCICEKPAVITVDSKTLKLFPIKLGTK